MKFTVAVLAVLCSAAVFAGKTAAFTTEPERAVWTQQKALTKLQIEPVSHDKSKFYRVTMQIKVRQSGTISSYVTAGQKKSWESISILNDRWNTVYRYIAPGEEWKYWLRTKGADAAFQVRDIKVEELDEKDFTSNLLPQLENVCWHSAWGKKQAKLEWEKYDDSPFGEHILTAEIDKGTGYPATLSIPAVPGRTLVIEVWAKGEPEENWSATVSRRGTKVLPVTNQWRKHEIRIPVKVQTVPEAVSLVFWKPKHQKKLSCSFAQVKAYYEKQ